MIATTSISESLRLIVGEGNVAEIRILGVNGNKRRTDSGYFDDFDAAVAAIQSYDTGRCSGIYVVLNQLNSSLLARSANRIKEWSDMTTTDQHIERRRWLYIDCDPERPSGISSTAEELQSAVDRSNQVADWLKGQGLCEPIHSVSGNGTHLLFPVDLPNDDESTALITSILKVLSKRFSDDVVKIDEVVFNAARISRLYGTMARKGDNVADRPHRRSEIRFIPDYIEAGAGEVCDVDALRRIAAMDQPEEKKPRKTSYTGSNDSRLIVPDYLRDRGISFEEKNGSEYTKFVLAQCPFNPDHKSPDSMVTQGDDGATGFKCYHNSCSGNKWAEFKQAIGEPDGTHYAPPKLGLTNSRPNPVNDDFVNSQLAADEWDDEQRGESFVPAFEDSVSITTTGEQERPLRFAGVDIADLEQHADEEIDWIVDGVFAADQPTIFGARSKCLKTTMLCDLSAALASGTDWLTHFKIPRKRKVLFITGESNKRAAAKRIRKACNARGFKLKDIQGMLRVEAVDFPKLASILDGEEIARTIASFGSEVVIVDPLYRGFSADTDTNRMHQVGGAIVAFTRACEPASVIFSHHATKSASREYGRPMELEDLTGAGVAESCGNWWLVGRNEKYAWDWKHDMCVSYGGRDEQAGGVRILFDEQTWSTEVTPLHDFIKEQDEQAAEDRSRKKQDAKDSAKNETQALIMAAVANVIEPMSKTAIRNASTQNRNFNTVFGELVREQSLVMREVTTDTNRKYERYIHRDFVDEYDAAVAPVAPVATGENYCNGS